MDAVSDFLRTYSTTIAVIGVNALLALSVWLTLYAGQLTLGNAAFMGVGAYVSALLGRHLDTPFPVALLIGSVAAAALALPLGAIVFRLRGVYLAIATLAFGEIVRVVLLATPITGRGQGLNGIPPKTELWHIYLSVLVVAYVLWRVQGSTIGRAWAAIREDEIASASQGIADPRRRSAHRAAGAPAPFEGLPRHLPGRDPPARHHLPAARPGDVRGCSPHATPFAHRSARCCLRRSASRSGSAA